MMRFLISGQPLGLNRVSILTEVKVFKLFATLQVSFEWFSNYMYTRSA